MHIKELLFLVQVTRKKRVSRSARRVTVYLSPAEELSLQVIEARRRERSEGRDSPSEIVSDALWKLLVDSEGLSREQIEALLPSKSSETTQSNLKKFPR